MDPGVSIILCCHNSERLLPETLAALAAQKFDRPVDFEVVVVDNGSSDQTSKVAAASWPPQAGARLRIVFEERIGLSHARMRGIQEAKHEILSFVDDDNRVCDSWVRRVAGIMALHPEVGACGGRNLPACDAELPRWFHAASYSYAVGEQGASAGDVTESRGYLWGAGLTLRREALDRLIRGGFDSRLIGRRGAELSSGEDTELCFALRLSGWRLWYDPELQLKHYLPEHRLSWAYARRLNAGFGQASVHLDPYEIALGPPVSPFRRTWLWRTAATLKQLCRHFRKLSPFGPGLMEGDAEVLEIERIIGRLRELFRARKSYRRSVAEVARAAWRDLSPPGISNSQYRI
ncbi:MAG: glycosyltransferase [Blastocatellia bacterium]